MGFFFLIILSSPDFQVTSIVQKKSDKKKKNALIANIALRKLLNIFKVKLPYQLDNKNKHYIYIILELKNLQKNGFFFSPISLEI